jgi:hypothetical protein
MKPGAHIVLRAAARFYAPLTLLLAFSFIATRPAGGGVGLIAALCVTLVIIMHALVFGAAAARAAFPLALARGLLCAGLIGACVGVGASGLHWAAPLIEASVFAVTSAGLALTFKALVGRAPTLRDEEW